MNENQPSPLILVAQSYIIENCSSIDQAQQDSALAIIEKYINGFIHYDEACKEIQQYISSTIPLEKIHSILTVNEEPLPPIDQSSIDQDQLSSSSLSRKRKLNLWDQMEDIRLLAGIHRYGLENWLAVSKFVGHSRTRSQCSQRWNRGLDPHLKKCRWTTEEEEKLQELIQKHGVKAWTQIAQKLGNRSDVQCRYHYNQMMKARSNSTPPPIVPLTSPLPTPTISPVVSPKSPEITFRSVLFNKADSLDNLNFDNAWNFPYSLNDMNDDLIFDLNQSPMFLSQGFMPQTDSLF